MKYKASKSKLWNKKHEVKVQNMVMMCLPITFNEYVSKVGDVIDIKHKAWQWCMSGCRIIRMWCHDWNAQEMYTYALINICCICHDADV